MQSGEAKAQFSLKVWPFYAVLETNLRTNKMSAYPITVMINWSI